MLQVRTVSRNGQPSPLDLLTMSMTVQQGVHVPLTWEGDNMSIATEDLEAGDDRSTGEKWLVYEYVGGMPSGPSQEATRHVPSALWDTANVNFVDQVSCHAWVKVWKIDHKSGSFHCRMKTRWHFRLLKNDSRTEPRVRIPGIRMPALACTVDESRVWRDQSKDTKNTMYFSGASVFSFEGFQVFDIHEFPFDRQMLDLGLFEFVWRREKDVDTFEESMRICQFSVETQSMLPAWRPQMAIILPLNETQNAGNSPMYSTRFRLKLRVTRRMPYYIIQVILLTFLITVATLLPLGMVASNLGDRMAVLGGGLLTLVAFKFGIAEQLPSVPYMTFLDAYLMMQVVTICLCMGWVTVEYKLTSLEQARFGRVSDVLLLLIVLAWTGVFMYASCVKRRRTWKDILASDKAQHPDSTDR